MAGEGLPHPTPFEVKTAMAFLHFREKKCDIVVLETGMGGLLDATNIVEDTCVAKGVGWGSPSPAISSHTAFIRSICRPTAAFGM